VTWFRVDDGLHSHPKAFRAGTPALGLWVRAGSWSADQLTDGFVPDDIVRLYGTKAMARRLVDAGLWEQREGGYQFHQWEQQQPTRDAVYDRRAKAAERVTRWRARRAAAAEPGCNGVTDAYDGVSNAVTNALVTPPPTRPDPTRPEVLNTKPPDPSLRSGSAPPPGRGRRLPDGWTPNPDVITQMRAECPGVDLRAEHAKFADYWRAKTGKDAAKCDWDATWRNWIRRARDDAPRNGHPAQPPASRPSTTDLRVAAGRDLADRLRAQEALTSQPPLALGDTR
jgi:hypothetical protein